MKQNPDRQTIIKNACRNQYPVNEYMDDEALNA